MDRRLVCLLCFLLTAAPVAGGSLHVEGGYAETLSATQCSSFSAAYQWQGGEVGYRFRYPFHDVGASFVLPLKGNGFLFPKLHVHTETFKAYDVDGVFAFGQVFNGKRGNWTLSYALGFQLSDYVSFTLGKQLLSLTADYHLAFTWRFLRNRLAWTLAVDSSDLYWYNYYLFGTLFSTKVAYQVNERLSLSLSALCRVTDLLKENQYLNMVSFMAGAIWRLP